MNIKHNSADSAITATPEAVKHFKKQNVSMIRLNIVKAGCSGYRYEVTPVDDNHPVTEQDKQFILADNLSLCVSKTVFPSIVGTVIDYVKKGISGELVYHNPQQTGSCGCGESFTLD